ncbi:hypothetical protein PTSG_13198, partial [Salpingoeca rosetta]
VQPASGQFGTRVTINGTNLLGGGSSAATVRLGGVAAMVVSGTSTEVVVVARSGSAGVGDVEIVADTGAVVSKSNAWEQLEDGVITSVVPAQAQKDARVTIQGARLLGGGQDIARAVLAGVDATYESGSGSDTEVVVVAALGTAGANGSVLLVADTGAEVSLSLGFEYVARGSISSVEPSTGSAGTLVTISGSNLLSGGASIEGVTLAGVAAAQVVSGNDTVIVVEAGQQSSAVSGMVVTTSDTGSTSVLSSGTAFTYIAPPSIDTVSPASGQEGTRVTLSGQNLLCGGSSVRTVTLAGVAVGTVVSESDTSVVVDAAPGAAGNGSVRIEADTGAFVELADGWTYIEAGSVSSVEPATGQRGSVVVIRGTNLLGGGSDVSSVTLAGVEVTSIDSANATVVVVVAGGRSTAGAGDVVLMSDTRATVTASGAFTYLEPGNITSVSPSVGQDGTRVVIEGERLLGDGDNVMSVTLAGVAATVTGASQSQINVTAHASTAKTGDVVVVGNTGIIVSSTNAWTFGTPGYVEGVDPGRGVAGTEVLIYGNNLRGSGSRVASVMLGGVEAQILEQTNFFVRAVAGSGGVAGVGGVELTADTGALVTRGNLWEYVADGNVTLVEPVQGTTDTLVTLRGTSLRSGGESVAQVLLAGLAATIVSENDTVVVVRASAPQVSTNFSGSVVLVSENGARLTADSTFTYVAASTIYSVQPSSGQAGTRVTIGGVSLLGGGTGVTVMFGNTAASVQVQTSTQVVAVAGAASAGVVDVMLQSNTGSSVVRRRGFRYTAAASVTDITPPSGQVGTRVTIVGSGLLAGGSSVSNVTLAGVAAESVVSANDTSVVVVAGSGSPGNGSVTVTADTGASYSSDSVWTYVEASTIDSFAPVTGQEGTYVTIRGQRLFGGGSTVSRVALAGVDAAVQAGGNSTYVVARAAASVAGAGRVVVESDTGARAVATGDFTYADAGVVTTLMPASGQRGTRVTIVGERLLGGAMSPAVVRLGGRAVMSVVSANSTMVVVRASNGTVGTGDVEIESVSGAIVRGVGLWEQLAEGQVTGVSPSRGVSGTRVTITGTSLLGGATSLASVTLNGVSANITGTPSNTQVEVVALTGTAGVGAVVLTAASDAFVQLADGFEYLEPGNVTLVSPSSGQVGTRVQIRGERLLSGGSTVERVLLGGVPVSSINETQSNTLIEAVAARGAATNGAVDVVLEIDTGAVVRAPAAWEYLAEGVVTAVTPDSGVSGTQVTINGTNLLGGGSSVSSLLFGGVAVERVVSVSAESIVAVLGTGMSGVLDVEIVSNTGAAVSGSGVFTYLGDARIILVEPPRGQLGTRVTITGTNLLGGGSAVQNVTIGGVGVLEVVSGTATQVVVRAGANSNLGLSTIEITSDSGARVSRTETWVYEVASAITDVTPMAGQRGTVVHISGVRLLGNNPVSGTQITTVLLGGRPAAEVRVSNATDVIAVAQNGTVGVGDVLLEASNGARTVGAGLWEYLQDSAVTAVVPSVGQVGTRVDIRGERLLGGGSSITSVTLAGTPAMVVSGNDSVVRVVAASATAGTGDVVVTSDSGAYATSSGGWMYAVASAIGSVTPAQGQASTVVTIAGTNLRGSGAAVASVTLVGQEATILSESDTQVVVRAAVSAPGQGDVIVTSSSGAYSTLVNGFTYVEVGTVDVAVPSSGREGTRVTINGTSLRGGGASVANVTVVDVPATIVSENDTEVVVVLGQGVDAITVGNIVVTSSNGAIITKVNAFTYVDYGEILTVDPSSGQAGTVVNIAGVNLCGGGSAIAAATLAGFEATVVSDNCNLPRLEAGDLGASTVGDVVLIADTGAVVVATNAWEQLSAGNITSVSPGTGQAGTLVTIRGTNILGGGSSATSISLSGVPASIVGTPTSTQAVVRVNPGPNSRSEAVGDVTIVGNNGVTVRKLDAWTYSVVDSISPGSGQGGTRVTIDGVGLLGGGTDATAVRLGTVSATAIELATASRVVVRAGANTNTADTNVTVTITADNGQTVESVTGADGSIRAEFLYKVAGSISSVSPAQGQVNTSVTIRGTNLFGYGASLASVSLASVPASIVTQNNSVVVVEAGASMATAVSAVELVADTGAVVSLSSSWRYVAPSSISGATPGVGQGGTRVTVTGVSLLGGATTLRDVTLAGVSVREIVSFNDTQVVVVAAAHGSAVSGDVVVQSANGAFVSLVGGFNYSEPGAVASVSPDSGHAGTRVVIEGTRLLGSGSSLVSVTLGGVSVASIVSGNNTRVVVVAAAGSAGAGDVVLTANTGAEVIATGGFTYVAAGAIDQVQPASGQFGTRVTINGTNLLGGGSSAATVRLGGVAAMVVSGTSTEVVVVARSGSA